MLHVALAAASEQYFTYAHLKNEIAYETPVAVVKLPGAIIAEAITYSRSFALQTPPAVQGTVPFNSIQHSMKS